MIKKFYITTPIYYSSGKPHIGHAYTTILADVICRYKSLIGYDAIMHTGMDEHGQKIQQVADLQNTKVQDMLDKNANIFKELWNKLNINYDDFIRTTEKRHVDVVQNVFSKLLEKNEIYLGKWKGLYCVGCEENYTKVQAVEKENKLFCKIGHELIEKDEETYFLKISKHSKWISEFYKKNNIIIPEFRLNELMNSFINDGLQDLSVTRTSFDWGIKVKENNNHIIYVWIDALLNYISSLGFQSKDDSSFKKYWEDKDSEIVHLMSKEITRFHCIYWPILLNILELKQPSKIISHGWITTPTGKMSKSLGNVVDPYQYINEFGSDPLRYFLIKEISYQNDSVFSRKQFIETYNSDLANNYGNLITRTAGMMKKYFNNTVPLLFNDFLDNDDKKVLSSLETLLEKMNQLINTFENSKLINETIEMINVCNKYIEIKKPWELFKNNKIKELSNLLNILFSCVTKIIFILSPILVETTPKVLAILNVNKVQDLIKDSSWENHHINDCAPIFQRFLNKE